MMHRLGLALLLGASLVGLDGPARAQDRALPGFEDEDVLGAPDVGRPNRYGCVKVCIRDFAPCDSLFMKQRDARCNNGRRN